MRLKQKHEWQTAWKLNVTEVEKLNVVKAARDPNQKDKLAKQAFIAFKKKEEKKEEPNVKQEKKNEEKKKE